MPQVYCHCCEKVTAHKVVMKRCQAEHNSVKNSLACFFATLFQGAHYVKMEKQAFCRVCNTQADLVEEGELSNVEAA
ncbi:hypothetical protein [Vibrio neptunius]|uniref:hypothetical protein n=1 Tax=Vibrio neptunius TaxID=170651 RepID=UPI0019CFBF5C|nr:hypothetical protein [Vibrio neptunius]MBN3574040.1 hypothetical protein [Vibrio neptunius]QXX09270.1 hypothetical protein KW548_19665 [Vibrio neptunius]